MITGEIKNRIDAIWDTYWVGGITNPMSVLEQMTYLFFMTMIDDAQQKKEAEANILGVKIANPTFKEGLWHNPETDNDVPYNSLRWHVFKNMEATQMFNTIRNDAFAFIKNLNEGKSSAYSRFMRDAVFLIQNPRTLTKIVDGVDALDMTNRDAMGDVFQPYSGVSTAVLIFTKTGAGGTDKVWFYDMQADGYSLDQKRTQIAENDIPDVVARFHNLEAEAQRTRKDKSFLVPVDEIRQNDYVLSINKYKEVEREKVEYEPTEVIMKRVLKLEYEITTAISEFEKRFM